MWINIIHFLAYLAAKALWTQFKNPEYDTAPFDAILV